jgi:hypothetical protein
MSDVGVDESIIGVEPEARRDLEKLKVSHDAMIDVLIARPWIKQYELAEEFGISAGYVSVIMQTETFCKRLAERRAAIVDPQLVQSLEVRYRGLVHRSQELLLEKLSRPSDEISDNLVIRALDIATRASGYGLTPPAQNNTQVNIDVHLESLGENLTRLLERKKLEVVSGE